MIDILQSYRLKKRLEHGLKSIITDGVMGEWEWENKNGGIGMKIGRDEAVTIYYFIYRILYLYTTHHFMHRDF